MEKRRVVALAKWANQMNDNFSNEENEALGQPRGHVCEPPNDGRSWRCPECDLLFLATASVATDTATWQHVLFAVMDYQINGLGKNAAYREKAAMDEFIDRAYEAVIKHSDHRTIL